MRPFEILPHTADLRLRAFGHNLEELFQNAALGLSSILFQEKIKKPPAGFKKISLAAPDINILLVNFLNEILSQSQINKEIYHKVKILKLDEKSLAAQIFGLPVSYFDKDIKAVSYHNVEIVKKRGLFQAEMVLDI